MALKSLKMAVLQSTMRSNVLSYGILAESTHAFLYGLFVEVNLWNAVRLLHCLIKDALTELIHLANDPATSVIFLNA